jgi:hypothetical protein
LGVHLDRQQAMAMLKELVVHTLVEPSYVHICQKSPEKYQIQLKSDYNREGIEEYAKKHGLTIEEDKGRKYLLIFKP